jgi:hypothetical protein
MRLRSSIRRIVTGIWLLVIPRGTTRLCAVQVWFTGEKKHRDYLILHQPPKANQSARQERQWWCRSLSSVAQPGDLDLRRRADAAKLLKALEAIDPVTLKE